MRRWLPWLIPLGGLFWMLWLAPWFWLAVLFVVSVFAGGMILMERLPR